MKRGLLTIQRLYADGKIDFQKANETVQSYFGIMKHCNSRRLKAKIIDEFVLQRNGTRRIYPGRVEENSRKC